MIILSESSIGEGREKSTLDLARVDPGKCAHDYIYL